MSTFKTRVGEVCLPVPEDYKGLSIEIDETRQVDVAHHEGVITLVEEMLFSHSGEPFSVSARPGVSESLARAREEGSEGIEKAGRDEFRETYYGSAAYYCLKGLVPVIAGQEVVPVGYHYTAALDLMDHRQGEDLYTESFGEIRFEPVVMVAAGNIDFGTAAGEPADRLEDIAVVTGDDVRVFEPEIEGIANEIEAGGTLDRSEEITEKDPFPLFRGIQFFGALFMVLEMCIGQKVYCIAQVLLSPLIDWFRAIYVRVAIKFQDFLPPALPVKEAPRWTTFGAR